jgi:hypothetical protein
VEQMLWSATANRRTYPPRHSAIWTSRMCQRGLSGNRLATVGRSACLVHAAGEVDDVSGDDTVDVAGDDDTVGVATVTDGLVAADAGADVLALGGALPHAAAMITRLVNDAIRPSALFIPWTLRLLRKRRQSRITRSQAPNARSGSSMQARSVMQNGERGSPL